MSVVRKIFAGVAAAGVSTMMAGVAFAAGTNLYWTDTESHPNVYTVNDTEDPTSTFFTAPVTVDTLDITKGIIVAPTPYQQSTKPENIRACYAQPYGNQPVACTPWFPKDSEYLDGTWNFLQVFAYVSGENLGNQYPPSSISPKGTFSIEHLFPEGLDAAIYGDPGSDTLTVIYDEYPY